MSLTEVQASEVMTTLCRADRACQELCVGRTNVQSAHMEVEPSRQDTDDPIDVDEGVALDGDDQGAIKEDSVDVNPPLDSKGKHAAAPHNGKDPLTPGSIMALQAAPPNLTRETSAGDEQMEVEGGEPAENAEGGGSTTWWWFRCESLVSSLDGGWGTSDGINNIRNRERGDDPDTARNQRATTARVPLQRGSCGAAVDRLRGGRRGVRVGLGVLFTGGQRGLRDDWRDELSVASLRNPAAAAEGLGGILGGVRVDAVEAGRGEQRLAAPDAAVRPAGTDRCRGCDRNG